ncbi:MAG: multidrug efflux SMR transporter [Hyphomicrobiaceae bacterium]|nr:MAG: multidrug efflux SMR transporter [Hyphomicrobiaceae bacterium]
MSYLYLTIAIVGEVIATIALKASHQFTKPLASGVAVAGYGIAFFSLSLALRTIPIGLAYAIWSGVGVILVVLAGAILFRQHLDLPGLIGVAFIVAGVAIVNSLSGTAGH